MSTAVEFKNGSRTDFVRQPVEYASTVQAKRRTDVSLQWHEDGSVTGRVGTYERKYEWVGFMTYEPKGRYYGSDAEVVGSRPGLFGREVLDLATTNSSGRDYALGLVSVSANRRQARVYRNSGLLAGASAALGIGGREIPLR